MSQLLRAQVSVEPAYVRNALFAVELLDAVTSSRIGAGVRVIADGLRRKPIVNASGLFVWLKEDLAPLLRITIDPGALPYLPVTRERADLQLPPLPPPQRPLTTIVLPPSADYPIPSGMTGVRGTLIENRFVAIAVPIKNAKIRLRWLDEDGLTWRDAPITTRTNDDGDFVSVLRFAPSDAPLIDANGDIAVRLQVSTGAFGDRSSAVLKLHQGRVADPTTLNELIVAWDELQP